MLPPACSKGVSKLSLIPVAVSWGGTNTVDGNDVIADVVDAFEVADEDGETPGVATAKSVVLVA